MEQGKKISIKILKAIKNHSWNDPYKTWIKHSKSGLPRQSSWFSSTGRFNDCKNVCSDFTLILTLDLILILMKRNLWQKDAISATENVHNQSSQD